MNHVNEQSQNPIRYIPTIEADSVQALANDVLIRDMYFGNMETVSGIIIPSGDGKRWGIHPRWAMVYSVGSKIDWLHPGQWVLVEHGRWSRGINLVTKEGEFTIRKADPKAILMVTNEKPSKENDCFIGDGV